MYGNISNPADGGSRTLYYLCILQFIASAEHRLLVMLESEMIL
jgi:hypothetical protein